MRKTILAAALGMSMLLAAGGTGLSAENKVHTVVKGDTLWQISGTYLEDFYLWPTVWKANPDIKNPHLIFPDQRIKLPGLFSFTDNCGLHTVVKGDTLWQISGTYLADPLKWPTVWKANPYIGNPHLIFPEQKIKIPCLDKARAAVRPAAEAAPILKVVEPAEPEPATQAALPAIIEPGPAEPDTAPGPEDSGEVLAVRFVRDDRQTQVRPETLKVVYENGIGTVVAVKPTFNGTVIRQDHGFHIAGTRETLIVDLPGAELGKKYGVYRDLGRVRHPETGKKSGNLIIEAGVVEVISRDNGSGRQVAFITKAFQEILSGDYLGPVPEQPVLPASVPDTLAPDFAGQVITLHNRRAVAAGRGSIIYLDAGETAGLVPGSRLTLEKEARTADQGETEIVVLRVTPTTATALVAKASLHVLSAGDRFVALR